MKIVYILVLLFITNSSYSQTNDAVTRCAIKIKSVSGLKMSTPARLVNVKETVTGDITMNGYQLAYTAKNQKPFVQVKTEYVTDTNAMALDSAIEIKYLQGLIGEAASPSGADIIRLSYNGFKIYGAVRNSGTAAGVIESFVMIPNRNEILLLDFFASKQVDANTQDINYLSARNSFLGEYTSQLNQCSNP